MGSSAAIISESSPGMSSELPSNDRITWRRDALKSDGFM
jgi:hypothetical protein